MTGTGRHGSTAEAIVETGEQFGLIGSGLRRGVEDLAELRTATILHRNFHHFLSSRACVAAARRSSRRPER